MTDYTKENLNVFLDGRNLSEDKILMLEYLRAESDSFWIEKRTQGRSVAVCDFDSGAYKGAERIRFRVDELNPITIASCLRNLRTGHFFSFAKAEEALLEQFKRDVEP